MTTPKRSEGPAPFGAGITLDQEEYEQKQQRAQLLVTQLDLNRQSDHGNSPDNAGVHANWLKVGFGGYEVPGLGRESLPPDGVCAHAPGMTPGRPEYRPARSSQFVMPNSVVGLKYDAYQTALFVGSVKIIYVRSIACLNLVPPN